MRPIDADRLLEKLSENLEDFEMMISHKGRGIAFGTSMAIDRVNEQPTIDPESLRPRWIPVSERLPEKYEDVLITYRIANEKAARIWIGYRAEMGWCAYEVYHPNVTAWMPMPEPHDPEEEKMGDAE